MGPTNILAGFFTRTSPFCRGRLLVARSHGVTPSVLSNASQAGLRRRRPDVASFSCCPSSTSTSGPVPPTASFSSSRGEPLPTEFLRREVERFDINKPVEEASTPPASWFTSPGFHDLEMASVFVDNWIAVGSALRVPSPGDYFTGKLGQHSYVVLRDEEGVLRAFYNVCRHHAMCLLTEPQGTAKQLVCGYHGWTYRLDGRLTKATRIKGIRDFNARDYGLVEIPLKEWGHLVCLKFHKGRGGQGASAAGPVKAVEDDKAPLAHLSPLLSQLESLGFSQGLRYVKRTAYTIQCNWKVVIDNYLDGGMHVPFAHKGLDSNLDFSSYATSVFDGYSIQSCEAAPQASERVGKAALYAHVYPNLMINRYGPWLDVNYAIPLAADRCEVVFEYFLDEATAREHEHKPGGLQAFVSSSLAASDEVQQEDTALCQHVQDGLHSPAYDVGRYAPGVEFADHEFHVRLATQLRGALAAHTKTPTSSPMPEFNI